LTLAEDLVQEALLLLYRDLRRGKEIGNPGAWTFLVVRRLAMKHFKDPENLAWESLDRAACVPSSPLTPPVPEPDDITGLFSLLSAREEEVVLLRMERLKYREIASRLSITPGAVSTLLVRALRKMQAVVAGGVGRSMEGTYVEKKAPATLQ
jgi:DNA-directed RNA polymerase specialized sigma24 family protein